MNWLKKLNPEWVLRASLGLVYFYSGLDIIRHPKSWYWAIESLPVFVQNIISEVGIDKYLKIQGLGEFSLAIILLFWLVPRKLVSVAAVLISVQALLIIFFVGVNLVTFRDIAIAGAAISLVVILANR